MHPIYLKPGLRIKIDKDVFVILKLLEDGNVQLQNTSFGDIAVYTRDELINMLCSNRLRFEVYGKNTKQDDNIMTSFDFDDISDNKHKEEAYFRYEVIKPLLEISSCYRKRSDLIRRVEQLNQKFDLHYKIVAGENISIADKCVSVSSIYRWLKNYEESNGDIRSLIPSYHKSGGKNKPRKDERIIKIINEIIEEKYLNKQRISAKEAHYLAINKINEENKYSVNKIPVPNYSTFVRYINKIPEYELIAKRIGKRTADLLFNPIYGGVKVENILERVEIDSQTLDVMIVDCNGEILGRPNFIAAIDKYSRNIVGFNVCFGGVGWTDVMQCIKHIITDKSYAKIKYPNIKNDWKVFGIPKKIVVDNGLGFKNKAIEDACYQMGFTLEFCPPRVPQWKGSIERFFGTANTSFTHNLPGTTRSNISQLGDDEDPRANACLTMSEFLEVLHLWIIDVYSQQLNKGAGGVPARIWDEAVKNNPVAWPSDMKEVAILLGKTSNRVIRNKGIELNKLFYNCAELNNLYRVFTKEDGGIQTKFKVKYDPNDISEIFVYDHLVNKEWIRVPSICPEYTSHLSELEHLNIIKMKNSFNQFDISSVAHSKDVILKKIEDDNRSNKKKMAKLRRIDSSKEIENLYEPTVKLLECKKSDNEQQNISDMGYHLESAETETYSLMPLGIKEKENSQKGKGKEKSDTTNRRAHKHTQSSGYDTDEQDDFNPDDFPEIQMLDY